jgi:hypothetical protein
VIAIRGFGDHDAAVSVITMGEIRRLGVQALRKEAIDILSRIGWQ